MIANDDEENHQFVKEREKTGVIWGFELERVRTAACCHSHLYLRIINIIIAADQDNGDYVVDDDDDDDGEPGFWQDGGQA